MRGNGHNGAGAVGHHDIIGDPDRHTGAVYRVDGVCPNRYTRLFLFSTQPLDLALPGGLKHISLHLGLTVRLGQFVHQRMLGSQYHKGRTPQRVGTRGKDDDVIALFGLEHDIGAFAPPDPVCLHGFHTLRPVDLAKVEEFLGIVGDAEEPLLQVLLDNLGSAPLAVAIFTPYLLPCQCRVALGTKVHWGRGSVGHAVMIEFQKEPFAPTVVAGQAGNCLSLPVEHGPHALELPPHLFDIGHGQGVRVDAALDGRVLSRQPKGVKAHGEQDIETPHTHETGPRI